MEGDHQYVPADEGRRYCSREIMSPEIVELEDDSKSFTVVADSRDVLHNDIYVAVGKDDLDVVKWTLDHCVPPATRVFLVHVFPSIAYIPTPVGRLSRSQMSQEQVRYYINRETNKRRNLLSKYIRLCVDAKVTVDTMLLESDDTTKAILELIPVLDITKLIMGTKRSPNSSYIYILLFGRPKIRRNQAGKGERVKKNAPDYCEVSIVCGGRKVAEGQETTASSNLFARSRKKRPGITERNFFKECVCFTGKFNCNV